MQTFAGMERGSIYSLVNVL